MGRPTEFGARLSVSLTGDGVARVDHLRWDAFHEGHDLPSQVEAYRQHHGAYPKVVLGDMVYGIRDNRRYLKALGIHFAGKALGKFGQGKNGYALSDIRANDEFGISNHSSGNFLSRLYLTR